MSQDEVQKSFTYIKRFARQGPLDVDSAFFSVDLQRTMKLFSYRLFLVRRTPMPCGISSLILDRLRFTFLGDVSFRHVKH